LSVEKIDVCDVCKVDSVRTELVSECTQVSDIVLTKNPKCTRYDENQNCNVCSTDYVVFKSDVTECIKFTGCKTLKNMTVSGECGECSDNYYLFENQCYVSDSSKCIYNYDRNSSYNFGINSPGACKICDKQMFYLVTEAESKAQRCITYSGRITNCINYSLNDSLLLICLRCKRGYVTSSDMMSCILLDSTYIYSYDLYEQYSVSKAGF